jgi:hypothetical protein
MPFYCVIRIGLTKDELSDSNPDKLHRVSINEEAGDKNIFKGRFGSRGDNYKTQMGTIHYK